MLTFLATYRRMLPAVLCDAGLMARNLRTAGYRAAIEDHLGGRDVAGPEVEQFLSKPAVSLFAPPGAGNSRSTVPPRRNSSVRRWPRPASTTESASR